MAIAAPRPCVLPVTTATFPDKCFFVLTGLPRGRSDSARPALSGEIDGRERRRFIAANHAADEHPRLAMAADVADQPSDLAAVLRVAASGFRADHRAGWPGADEPMFAGSH